MDELLKKVTKKYEEMGEDPSPYLQGLIYAKPLNYWDYIEQETLLSIQRPKTEFPDETIFILYHQITELVFKMILHEVTQVNSSFSISNDLLLVKVKRLNKYTRLLINSFDMLQEGLDHEQYKRFRNALVPASGFQSLQFRQIEIQCTRLCNLIGLEYRGDTLNDGLSVDDYFERIYWREAAYQRPSGEKTLTFRAFENRYMFKLKELAINVSGNTLEEKYLSIKQPSETLKEGLREFDRKFNVEWPSVHLKMARTYLKENGVSANSTGNTDWESYLDPNRQQRVFFPTLKEM